MIPCAMMVLGAVLYKGPGSAAVPARLVLGVSAIRLVIAPLLGACSIPCKGIWCGICFCWTCPLRPSAVGRKQKHCQHAYKRACFCLVQSLLMPVMFCSVHHAQLLAATL